MKQKFMLIAFMFAALCVLPVMAFAQSDFTFEGDFGSGCTLNGEPIPCDELMEVAGPFMFAYTAFWIVFAVIMIVASWKIYTKAGQPGWACLIPIYNVIVMIDIIRKPRWWVLLLFVPVANFVISIIMTHGMAKAFGKDVGYTIGLLLLPIVFTPILAFGSAQYQYGGGAADASAPAQPQPQPPAAA